jgi:putative acetyltransferase
MNIRPEQTTDVAAIAQVLTLAFGQANEARLVECLRQSKDFIPELALVAVVNEAIVGHILFTTAQLSGPKTYPILTLAPLAVHPHYQRQGVGRALIQAGLAIAAQRPEALVTVLGHPDYYPRFGFEIAAKYSISTPFEVRKEAFMIWRSPQYTPACHGTVVYPTCFSLA